MKKYSHKCVVFENFNKMPKNVVLKDYFETDYYIVLKFRHRMNSGTVHLHAEFGEDIFHQY